MDIRGLKMNFLGDSITDGVGVSHPSKLFHALLAEQYGITARNYGISGSRIARQQNCANPNDRMEQYFSLRVDEMDPDADVIVVFGGTNDFGHGDAPLGSPEDNTADSFWGACNLLFTKLIEKYPTATIVVMTPLHRCNEMNPKGDGHKPYNVGVLSTYVDTLKQSCARFSLPVLDLFATSGMQPCIEAQKKAYIPDGLHPNDAGHVIIARRLANFLTTL